MAKAGKENKTTSWGWIIFWILIFWPVGVYLLIKKLAVDKSATMKSGNGLTIAAYILMGMGVICLLASLSEGSEGGTMYAVLLGATGVWLFFKAKKTKATGERYKKYIAMVVNQHHSSIDNIAAAVGVTYDVAVTDLQKMIDTGYFSGAYIDVTQREIILPKTTAQQISQPDSAILAQEEEKLSTCGSCGANNKVIVGRVAECEYCGNHLQ